MIKQNTPRIESVDLLRGLVIVIMALDHVRDYFTNAHFDPTDLTQTTPAIFFTRWITHFCAPVFIFLAGTSAYLTEARGKTKKDLSWFLLTRGFVLIIFELTLLRFGWFFNLSSQTIAVQVIWAIGFSMIFLSGLIFLPKKLIALIGIIMVVGHNAFDGIKSGSFGSFSWLWMILHEQNQYRVSPSVNFIFLYPLIPWIGVMALGYVFGAILLYEPVRKRKFLFWLGMGMIAAFVVIRSINIYGNLTPWSVQKDSLYTFFSFMNVSKYPPSLDYLLITLGPAILLLSFLKDEINSTGRFFIVYGRVPFFFYILHIYIVHLTVLVLAASEGYHVPDFFTLFLFFPKDYGFGLPVIYLIWASVVLLLYPACKWFGGVKRRRKDKWLSYF